MLGHKTTHSTFALCAGCGVLYRPWSRAVINFYVNMVIRVKPILSTYN